MNTLMVMKDDPRSFMLSIDDSYKYEIRNFFSYLDNHHLQLSFKNIQGYVDFMISEGIPGRTINKRLSAVKNRIRLMFRQTEASLNLAKKYKLEQDLKDIEGVNIEDTYITPDKNVTKEEVDKLLDSPDIPTDIKLFIEFLWKTGVRISEAISIRLKNIEDCGDHAKVRFIGKKRKERKIKVSKELISKITDYFNSKIFLFEKADGTQFTRNYVSMRILRHSRKVLSRKLGSHIFRHGFATYMIGKTKKVKAVSTHLGHKDVSLTLALYCHEELTNEDLEI